MIKIHIAISLDGYIAYLDDETIRIPIEIMEDISKNIESSDILLMGFNTYQSIWEQNGTWTLQKDTYVISHYNNSVLEKDNLHFLCENVFGKIEELKNMNKKIAVIGGGKFITWLINNKLSDELNLYIIPTLLGEGIPLFGKTFDTKIKQVNSIDYKGTTKITYIFS